MSQNWMDRTRPLWRLGNRIEAFQIRRLGVSPMALLNRGDVMVLETTGRQSGRRRFTPVGYWEEDGALVVGGGAAGMAAVPDWVKNLRHDPHAAAWIRRERKTVVAHELMGDARDRARARAAEIWPAVPRYEQKSGRLIPYFRLIPTIEA